MTYDEWHSDSELKVSPCDVCYNHRQELFDPLLCDECAENDFCDFDFDYEELKDITHEDFKKKLFKNCMNYED